MQAFDFNSLLDCTRLQWGRIRKISLINSLLQGNVGPRPVRTELLRQPTSPVSTAQNVKPARRLARVPPLSGLAQLHPRQPFAPACLEARLLRRGDRSFSSKW
jgi:hypothetical protein